MPCCGRSRAIPTPSTPLPSRQTGRVLASASSDSTVGLWTPGRARRCRCSRAIPALSTPSPSCRMAGCWRRYRGTRRSGCGARSGAALHTLETNTIIRHPSFSEDGTCLQTGKGQLELLLIAFLYSAGSSTIHFHLHALDKQRQRKDSLISSRIQTGLSLDTAKLGLRVSIRAH